MFMPWHDMPCDVMLAFYLDPFRYVCMYDLISKQVGRQIGV